MASSSDSESGGADYRSRLIGMGRRSFKKSYYPQLQEQIAALERARAELREAKERFQAMVETSPDWIWEVDTEGRFTYVSPQVEQLLGYKPEEVLGRIAFDLMSPEDGPRVRAEFLRLAAAKEPIRGVMNTNRHRDGRIVVLESNGAPIIDADGVLRGYRGSDRDVTERQQAARRQRLLMAELDHRVKNNMASVLGLAEQTLRSANSLEEFEQAFLGRVQAMARTHEALARARWTGIDLQAAASLVLATHLRADPPRVQLRGDAVHLPARVALPLGLTLHELATNAVKYGALSSQEGEVEVSWQGSREDGLVLTWREQGGPAVQAPSEPGTGTRLIRGFVQFELGGTAELSYSPGGLVCQLEISLDGEPGEPGEVAADMEISDSDGT